MGYQRAELLQFFDERRNGFLDEVAHQTALPEVDVFAIDRLDTPRDDPTLFWCT